MFLFYFQKRVSTAIFRLRFALDLAFVVRTRAKNQLNNNNSAKQSMTTNYVQKLLEDLQSVLGPRFHS